MFEDRTQENLKAEGLAMLSPDAGISAQEGSYADATLGAAAYQLSELYKSLPAVTSMLFVDETSGPYIDMVGDAYFGLTRRPGTRAQCTVTLTGSPGTVIPAGTVFLTSSGLRFSLTEEVVLPAAGTAAGVLEAAEEGTAYNIAAHTLVSMFVNLPGLSAYDNGAAAGGTDTESDAALLQRIQERRQKPVNGANGWQYRAWAMEVPGVGNAKIVELKAGPGTVGVTVVDSTGAPGTEDLTEAVKDALDARRPVGATVAVQAPQQVEIAVSAKVILSAATTAQAVEEELARRLASYLSGLVEEKYGKIYYSPEEDLPYAVVYNRILALLLTIDGVENASNLSVGGGSVDVVLPADTVPAPGAVEVTV